MTSDRRTASILAILTITGFFGLVLVVLLGFVDVTEPTIAKLIGLLFGYVAALLNPIIFRYFGGHMTAPPEGE